MPAKPKLGQNFLRDISAIRRVVAALGDISDATVVEIGPGQGAITGVLAHQAGRLIAVEIDPELAIRLQGLLSSQRVSIVEDDVLIFDFAAAAAQAGQKLIVAGNLPYYITSPILLHMAESHAALDRAVLMMQREVADRIAAHPGSRDYGLLSVTVQLYGPVETLFTLPPGAFSPPPDVYSTVVRWRFAPRFAELAVDEHPFLAFARKAFAQKRKTLANNLRAAGLQPAQIQQALSESGVSPSARAEELSLEQLAAIFHQVTRNGAAALS
ncbi:MAG TPA: 16S rRNA (adenine(1518)-N(6)/adenine(1519)-N(6))-dimethyltransferase RsmA [Terracidiphilus sp.]|nr:16S rRNA (adenine(1518)-N(6)/adenine(1519)-N(6))-dimethyltransferase RsmA [Terracidiphilus sp.]